MLIQDKNVHMKGGTTVTTYRMSDSGIYMAMNYGAIFARGTHLLYLNGGDSFFAEDSVVLLLRGISAQGNTRCHYHFPFQYTRYTAKGSSYDIVGYSNLPRALANGALVCQQSIIYNRKMLLETGAFDETYKLAGDYEFACRSVRQGDRWETLQVAGVIYKEGGLSETRMVESLGEIQRARLDYKDLFT